MAATGARPNLLLISIDTLRADHLGSYGDPHRLTPHMDQLADEGVLFRQAISSSSWTLPAMASLFTGLYPRHHRAGEIANRRDPLGRSPLPPRSWTLATALRDSGYRTAAIVTNPYLSLRYGLGEGFDEYHNLTIQSEAFLTFAKTTAMRLLERLWPAAIIGDRGQTVSRNAVRWLATVPQDRPFLLWLHYVDPHPPYSRAALHKNFRGDLLLATAAPGMADADLTSPDIARLRSGEIRPSTVDKDRIHDLYRAEVANVDEAVGEVLGALESTGLRERTLVVLVGDHGEEFWEHGGVEHGRTVYEEVVRVPLLMRCPGHLPAGIRVDPVARITDVAPTILDLLAIPPPLDLDGETLVPLVRGRESEPRVALTENMLFAEERSGLRTANRKYVLWENGKEEVYDLSADPQERVDLAGVDGVLPPLREFSAALDVGSREIAATPPLAPEVGGATAEALRALGYLDP
jgi:arylsulfatase A-like enzyme